MAAYGDGRVESDRPPRTYDSTYVRQGRMTWSLDQWGDDACFTTDLRVRLCIRIGHDAAGDLVDTEYDVLLVFSRSPAIIADRCVPPQNVTQCVVS